MLAGSGTKERTWAYRGTIESQKTRRCGASDGPWREGKGLRGGTTYGGTVQNRRRTWGCWGWRGRTACVLKYTWYSIYSMMEQDRVGQP